MLEELKKLFHEVGYNLTNYDLESHSNEEIITDILEIETALFRARIKLERTINQQ